MATDEIQEAADKIKGLMSPPPEEGEQGKELPEESAGEASEESEEGQEESQSEEEAETQADVETIGAERIAELLSHTPEGLTVDQDGKIKFRVKVDGEEGDATLSELIERYQRDAHLTNRSKEVAELKKQSEAQLSDLLQKGQQMAQQVDVLFEAMQNEALSRFSSIDWQRLRTEDPAEFAALVAERNDVVNRLAGKRQEVMQGLAKQYQEAQGKVREKMQTYLAEQRDLLKTLIPDFGPKVQGEIKTFLNTQGFGDHEVNNIFDARMVQIAHMAMQFAKGKSALKDKLEKKPLPKVLKPGAKPDPKALQTETLKKARLSLKKTGSIDDAVSVLKQLNQRKSK